MVKGQCEWDQLPSLWANTSTMSHIVVKIIFESQIWEEN